MAIRRATPAEINRAFASLRLRLGRALTIQEVEHLDAELALERERDPLNDYEHLNVLATRLKACGERDTGSPARAEDLRLYTFCAGMLVGLGRRIQALESALTQESRP